MIGVESLISGKTFSPMSLFGGEKSMEKQGVWETSDPSPVSEVYSGRL